jgi:hypothetical protein
MGEYFLAVPPALLDVSFCGGTGTRCGSPIIDIVVFVELGGASILLNSAGNDEGSSDTV